MSEYWWDDFSDWVVNHPLEARDVIGYLIGYRPGAVKTALQMVSAAYVPASMVATLERMEK